ncbi:helix-turn-helix transcriptional regulator [Microbispora sp. NPDC088329]|uniref:helix-turn-helix transcriptional regulator n=1 Tax=Microbispora sp. NPDC088329 TaxID=3154869 RepID=UPI003428F57E
MSGNGGLPTAVARKLTALRRELGEAPDASTLFSRASRLLRPIVAFDAAVWRAIDPMTGMMTSPVRVENLGQDGCSVYWESELLTENVNLFSDLARARVPAAGLHEATGGLPGRSALYRAFLRPRGLNDELRAVARADGHPWGQISLFRAEGEPVFHAGDAMVLHRLSAVIAHRLRSFAEPRVDPGSGPMPGDDAGPGLLYFAPSGELVSLNDEARSYLTEIAALGAEPAGRTPLGVAVPAWIHSTVSKARAIAAGRAGGSARVRVRDRAGRWLVCHASCLRGTDGEPGASVVVIERAPISEVAPLMVRAYQLTDRELEITQLIARGMGTAEICEKLFISPHTVRDRVKSVFGKVRVTSHGELVAKLFTEHYAPLSEGKEKRVFD